MLCHRGCVSTQGCCAHARSTLAVSEGQPLLPHCHQPELQVRPSWSQTMHILLLQLPRVCTFLEESLCEGELLHGMSDPRQCHTQMGQAAAGVAFPELRALSLMPAPPEAAQNLREQKITQLSPAISQSLSKDSSK